MFRKLLTHLIILALSILPVQLISASADVLSMQMSMSQSVEAGSECMHEMNVQTEMVEKLCCDEQSNACQGCTELPQASSVMSSPAHAMLKIAFLKITKIYAGHSLLDGIPQKNLLRPPRTFI